MKFKHKSDTIKFRKFVVYVNEYNRLLGIEGTEEQKVLYPRFYRNLLLSIQHLKEIFALFTVSGKNSAKKFFNPEEIPQEFLTRIKRLFNHEFLRKN